MQQKLGSSYDAFITAMDEKPPVSIRINPRKGMDLFKDEEQVPWCTYGRYLKKRPAFVWDPLYHAGAYYAQEASSMFFGNAIDFSKDLKVLDMCAAPGGKSSLLLSYLSKNSVLVSNEMVGKRNNILYENAVKWGASNHIITQNRSSDFEPFRHYFDVVMIDAPCSGEGMFRKDSDAIAQWSEGLVKQCAIVQKDIINNSIELLADGGTLIYSTCTFEEDENENMLAQLYENYGDMLEPLEIPTQEEWGMTVVEINTVTGKTQKGYYCYPHKVKGEGQFISAIKVNSGKTTILKSGAGLQKLGKDDPDLIKKYAKLPDTHAQAMWGDKAISYPAHLHNIIGTAIHRMYVKKAGTALGVISRGAFIPEHEMAMEDMIADNIPKVELNIEGALDYMQRKSVTVPDTVPTGWIVFTYKGLAIGWAKNLGSRVNIHYPSYWRIRKEPNYEDL